MEIKLEICFGSKSLNGKDFVDFLDRFMKFIPKRIMIKNRYKEWDDQKSKKSLLENKNEANFFIEDDVVNSIYIGNAGSKVPFKSIALKQQSSLLIPSNDLIEYFINRNGFVSAYFLNSAYETVQSTVFSNSLKGQDFSKEILDTIRNTPSRDEMWGGKEYDTKFNPGRSVLVSYTWLMVGWKMWFGEGFFHLVSKERILSFPHAVEVKELPNGVIYVQLFEKLEEPYTPDAIFRQWKWREWMRYDELEATLG